jgi:alkylation response protein AidB-like acyl-CoA dehydrogenase
VGQFAELGVIGALFTEDDGGFGGGGFDIAVVFEALGRGLVVEPLLATAVLAGSALAHAGNPAQKALLAEIIGWHAHRQRWRMPSPRPSYALTQRQHAGQRVTARSGSSTVPRPWSARRAGGCLRRLGPHQRQCRRRGRHLAVHRAGRHRGPDAARLRQHRRRPCGRTDASAKCAWAPTALLGAEGGRATPRWSTASARAAGAGAEALGAMDVAKKATLEYLRTRKQFGVPIGSFQALQHRMADLLLEVEQARSAVINAAAALDGADRIDARARPVGRQVHDLAAPARWWPKSASSCMAASA